MRFMPVAMLVALVVFAPATSAQVHKCKDAAGKTIYTDAPCTAGQSGGMIERQRTQSEIYQERIQAAEANERKYRSQAATRDAQMLEQQQRQALAPAGGQVVVQDKALVARVQGGPEGTGIRLEHSYDSARRKAHAHQCSHCACQC